MVKKRFPIVPAFALFLKIAAILFLLISTFVLARQIMEATKSPMSGFKWSFDIILNVVSKWFEQTLFPATTAWVAAEVILGVREIEYNTRRFLLGSIAQPTEVIPSAPPVAGITPEYITAVSDVPSTPSEPSAEEIHGEKPAE